MKAITKGFGFPVSTLHFICSYPDAQLFHRSDAKSPEKTTSSLFKLLKSASLHRVFRMGESDYLLSLFPCFFSVDYRMISYLYVISARYYRADFFWLFMFILHITLHIFSLLIFYCSTMLLSITYFAWGRAIIYAII
jgi:hypothetical protein